jgi:dimethylargininase
VTALFTRAICRKPGADFADGITTVRLGKPDFETMLVQHRAYVDALKGLGLEVEVLEALPGFPDAHFVEDVAVVTPEVAIVARPGAMARRGEEDAMAPVLARHRPIVRIKAPGTLEGGDVLIVERDVLVGLSERTNVEGVAQLSRILTPFGYSIVPVPVARGLHFKSSVNGRGGKVLLMVEEFAKRPELASYRRIVVPPEEAYAANTLWVNGTLITPRGFPKTRARLDALNVPVVELDASEARKMDGGLTCMSLRF